MDIVIKDVHKHFSTKKVLRGVDLRLSPGITCLLGANEVGKTTLLRILATRLQPTWGQVRVGPYDLSQHRDRLAFRAQLGYVPQELDPYPNLSGRELLEFMGLMKGLHDRRTRRMEIARLLEEVNLAEVADDKIATYSGGMKRRLCIAQAFLGDPQVIIIDDLLSGVGREELSRLQLLLLQRAHNRTIIFSTNQLEDVRHLCQCIAILEQGVIQTLFHMQQTRL